MCTLTSNHGILNIMELLFICRKYVQEKIQSSIELSACELAAGILKV